jgi:hypothetical protein
MSTTITDSGCCGQTIPTNPKTDLNVTGRRRTVIFNLDNPIPGEITDPETLSAVFEHYKIVPFAGSSKQTGDSLLLWYLMLAKLSPTNAACMKKLTNYAFGSKAALVRATDPEWVQESAELPPAEQQAAQVEIKQLIEFKGGAKRFFSAVCMAYQQTGNAFVEVSVMEVNGQTRASLKLHRTTHVRYFKTKKGEPRTLAVSAIWTEDYLRKNPPRMVPLYPVWGERSDGVMSAMFHLKYGDNDWYGRPPSEGADLYKYREVQDAVYQIKQAAGNFTGQVIIEIEDDDPDTAPPLDDKGAKDAGFNSFVERFEHNFTQKADNPQSVVVSSRPYGAKPMFVFQVKPNTNENWYKVTGEVTEGHILRNHGCTLRFMGYETAAGFSTDVYISDYMLHMEPVINALRDTITEFVNGILTALWTEIFNRPDLNEYSITFTSPIQGTVDSFKNQAAAQTQQTTTGQ